MIVVGWVFMPDLSGSVYNLVYLQAKLVPALCRIPATGSVRFCFLALARSISFPIRLVDDSVFLQDLIRSIQSIRGVISSSPTFTRKFGAKIRQHQDGCRQWWSFLGGGVVWRNFEKLILQSIQRFFMSLGWIWDRQKVERSPSSQGCPEVINRNSSGAQTAWRVAIRGTRLLHVSTC